MNNTTARWDYARTAADLGELTAQWLEGRIPSRPGYQPGWGPSEETTSSPELMAALLTLNRGGYVTDASQPGFAALDVAGARWSQRAAVDGFVTDEHLLEQLCGAARTHGLLLRVHRCTDPGPHEEGIPVTTRNGRTCTWFGRFLNADRVSRTWRGAGHQAVQQMAEAWQLTIADPTFDTNTALWHVLPEALHTSRGSLAHSL